MIPSFLTQLWQWLLDVPYRTGFYILLVVAVLLILKDFPFPYRSPEIASDTIQMKPAEHYLDKDKKLHAIILQQELSLEIQRNYIDSLARLLKTKPSHIKRVDQFQMVTDTVIYTQTVSVQQERDTVYQLRHADNWIRMTATVGTDTGYFSLQHIDTLTRTEVEKRSLFRAPVRYIDISNSSPYSRITAGYAFTVTASKPDLTVGPYIGYDPFLKQLSVGISIQKPMLNLYFRRKR